MFVIFFIQFDCFGQLPIIQYSFDKYRPIRSLEILNDGFFDAFHSTLNPICRDELNLLLDSIHDEDKPELKETLSSLRFENDFYKDSLKPVKLFFNENCFLLSSKSSDHILTINPILNMSIGRDFQTPDGLIFNNTRGFEINGSLNNRIGFYSILTENIIKPFKFVEDYSNANGAFPTASLTKKNFDGVYNFFQARGGINFSILKNLRVDFGHNIAFVGDGFRSFLFSDFGKEFLQLKIKAHVRKVNYLFIAGQMIDKTNNFIFSTYPKKYIVHHQLSINVCPKLNFSFFETVVFSRVDSNGFNSGFDFSYLNPVIFYRAVEHGLNSSDNAMLGLTFKFLPIKRFKLYGQVLIDEFKFKEIISSNGWYANKIALQIGIDYVGFINKKMLNLNLEFNSCRPYTFMHYNKSQNYINYNTPIGHPLGANFREIVINSNLKVNSRIDIKFTAIGYYKGFDYDGQNFGGDIVNNVYTNPVTIYGNKIGQGARANVLVLEPRISFSIFHYGYIDLSFFYRSSRSKISTYNSMINGVFLGFRFNCFTPAYNYL